MLLANGELSSLQASGDVESPYDAAASSPALVALRALTPEYRNALDDLVNMARNGRRDEALAAFEPMLYLEDELISTIIEAQAPVNAAAEAASGMAGFDAVSESMTGAVILNDIDRVTLYTQMLEYADNPSFSVDSLEATVDEVVASLDNAETEITAATTFVATAASRPYVAATLVATGTDELTLGDTLRVRVTLENLGTADADSVTATFFGDETAQLITQTTVDIGKMGAGAKEMLLWEAVVVDTTGGTGVFQIEVASSNAVTLSGGATYSVTSETTGTATEPVVGAELPENFGLLQSYPNPFNPVATISFSVPQAEHVQLVVFDMLGREVETLLDEQLAAGSYNVDFEAGDLPSGTYVYRIAAGSFSQSRTMTLLK